MQPLVDGPRSHLTEAEVLKSLSFKGGAQVSWGVEVLDLDTGQEIEHDLEFISGTVSWSYRVPSSVTGRAENTAQVRRTGELNVAGDWGNLHPLQVLFRVYVTMSSQGIESKWYIGTFVSTLPPRVWDGRTEQWRLDIADKSHYWSKHKLTDPRTVGFNRHILLFIQEEMLAKFDEDEFDFPSIDRFALEDLHIEEGESYLDMFNVGLEHKGFEPLTATPEGLPKTRDADDYLETEIEHVYTTDSGSTVIEGLDTDPVLPEAPNVLKFVARRGPSLPVEGNGIYTIFNYDIGAGSINATGVEIEERVEVEAQDQNDLEKIARRDANAYFMGGGEHVKIRVGINPRHDDRDIIGLVYPDAGYYDPDIRWAVTSWDINLPETVSSPEDVTMSLEAEVLWAPEDEE